ncbi:MULTISPECIES: alpha/beta fold hydrolase [Bacillus]|uniref:alpha/beta fold hydrolase n=1 Tax=Bacillus TaxID=1386 RepID=UPI0002F7908A|nr:MULTISPECIES: alpha/beta hydrolase [Bacillus]
MPYCKVEQAEIYYKDLGEGIPIIMIHGFSPDHRLMTGCMEPVFTNRMGYRRIYIDLPGMGLSKNYDSIRNSDEMLKAVQDFTQTIIPDQKYIIIGESYGGYIARGVINRKEEQLLGAAFICPVIVPLLKNRGVEKYKIIKMDKQFISKLSKEELEGFEMNNCVLDEYTWSRYNQEILSGCKIRDEKFLKKIKSNYGFSFLIDQTEFDKPSVFLLGRQDSPVGYQDALEIMKMYPRGTFAVLDRAAHNLQIEQPEVFNTLINEWLDRIEESVY